MTINHVNLFEYIVDIPDLYASVDARSDYTVPIANCQGFQLNYPREMGVKYLNKAAGFEAPNVQIFSINFSSY